MKRVLPVVGLLLIVAIVAAFAALVFRHPDVVDPSKPAVKFQKVSLKELPGWRTDDLTGFRQALNISCKPWPKRTNVLARAMAVKCADVPSDDASMKAWLQEGWSAWRIDRPSGKLTGYFEPVYRGARSPSAEYATPLYQLPDDLITARLADFLPDFTPGSLRGRIEGRKLVPYPDRKAIREGALDDQGLELLWLADPVDAFFLHIQGSGRIVLPDSSIAYVGYAGQNGHAYRAIGRVLIASGAVPREKMSMQSIRNWLSANPDQADDLMDRNRSYIFFTERSQPGAIGAEGVVLTPERSIAIDRHLWYFGLPFWIDAGPDLQRLTMGQDTGGAIRGAVRADLFLGPGDQAGERAGRLNAPLDMWLLLPKGLAPELALR